MNENESAARLRYERQLGVSRAWAREVELVKRGRGTRQWSVREQKELLRTNRVKGYQGHHMKSVKAFPQYAADPSNIQLLSSRKGSNEHLNAHRSDYRNISDGRYNVNTGRIRQLGEGRPRAMKSQPLRERAIDQRGYQKYAAENASPAKSYSPEAKLSGAKRVSPAVRYAKDGGQSRTVTLPRSFARQSGAQSKGASKSAGMGGARTGGGQNGVRTGGGQSGARTGGGGAKR